MCLQPADNRTNSRFLQLPAEIRLQIYSYIIYPSLKHIKIAHGGQTLGVTEKVLSPAIFRASHQLRAEALSYLVTKKPLEICEIATANAFFEVIGSAAIGDMKSLSIAQVLSSKPLPRKQIKLFAHFLSQAASLKRFTFETGLLGEKEDYDVKDKAVFGQDLLLFEKILGFVKERGEIEFRWGAGNANSLLCRCERLEEFIKHVRDYGPDMARETFLGIVLPDGQMYLW
jgi:hypothetical protein